MDIANTPAELDSRTLLEIIGIQTEIAREGLDLGGVMALVTHRAQSLTGAAGAVVEIAEGDDMVYRAVSGITSSFLGLRLQRHGSLSGQCVEEGRTLYCPDSETDDRVDLEACRKVGLRSMLVVPLRHLDTTVGVLKVLSPRVDAFTAAHPRVLDLISQLVAAAMFNAARYESGELYHRATHDALTGLANRALFYDRLRQAIAHAQRQPERIGVLIMDMDSLKPINDGYGHRSGDAALVELARRLADTCRQSDTVARLGGDEFGVILAPVEDRAGVLLMRDRIAESLREPLRFEDRELPIDASIGTAIWPDDAQEPDALLAVADTAMYEVKRSRKAGR